MMGGSIMERKQLIDAGIAGEGTERVFQIAGHSDGLLRFGGRREGPLRKGRECIGQV